MDSLKYYVHDLSPFAIHFTGNLGIRWYGLSYMIGFIASYFLIKWLAEKQKLGLSGEMVSDFVTYCAVGTMLGGRLGYCLFYSPDLFLKFKPDFPFWGVFAVNEGGMASHGGMIGVVLACFVFAHRKGLSTLYLLDLVCLCGPVGIFFGRIANFINGELVGRPIQSAVSWAVKFPADMLGWSYGDQDKFQALTEAYVKLGGSKDQWLSWIDKMKVESTARDSINHFLYQAIEAIQGGNKEVAAIVEPLLAPRHPSQLYAALLEGLFLFVVLFLFWRTPKKFGTVAAMFGMMYSIVRVVDEFFRMPDAHIGYQLFDLTRGQWLSIAMAVIALALGIVWQRTGTMMSPGWGKVQSLKLSRK
ncbi:MAG: prolipoprotein diacylglyceryl transferase [Bdellovibrionaceae bacterium]|nr:prolipoprotein diacylglyceryl transferase [Pseudobdellovibrionaceae bacterium]NUM59182.1 prolipoprotein diacylglyceryl transferase [Pseudobdellovibrionaceae bacterium]